MARINWVDRVPTKAGKWTKSDETSTTVTLTRADEPTEEGTPVNAANLNQMVQFADLSGNFSVSVTNVDLTDTVTTANTSTAAPSDGGTVTMIDSITTDGKGRVTAKNTKTVTLPTILSKVLTGLSTATNAAITATDTILSALGKLQAQITTHGALTSTAHDATSAATASKLIARDANGRAQVADPSASADIATKNYVDAAGKFVLLNSVTVGTNTTAIDVSIASPTNYKMIKVVVNFIPGGFTSPDVYDSLRLRINSYTGNYYKTTRALSTSFNLGGFEDYNNYAGGKSHIGGEINFHINPKELSGRMALELRSNYSNTMVQEFNTDSFCIDGIYFDPSTFSTLNFYTSLGVLIGAGSTISVFGVRT